MDSLLRGIAERIISTFSIPDAKVHLIGSIASNLYSEDTDIDLHFLSPHLFPNKSDELTAIIRQQFEEWKQSDGIGFVGKHPVELYFQPNEFQDYMSVGCYDLLEGKWIVGPEIYPEDYNPYKMYFSAIMEKLQDHLPRIRQNILETYEVAVILDKMYSIYADDQFTYDLEQRFDELTAKAEQIFKDLKMVRKGNSEPYSYEDAIALRGSSSWHISDAAFKMLDKWRYLQALRLFFNKDMPRQEKVKKIASGSFAAGI